MHCFSLNISYVNLGGRRFFIPNKMPAFNGDGWCFIVNRQPPELYDMEYEYPEEYGYLL